MRSPNDSNKKKRRIVAEPLEARLLFSATADMVLLDDGVSDVDDLPAQAASTDLLQVFDLGLVAPEHGELPQLITDFDTSFAAGSTRVPLETELVFVDGSVPDYEHLVDEIRNSQPDTEFDIFVLDPDQDGIEQISLVLAQYSGVRSVHLLSHGNDGRLNLGSAQLNNETLDQRREQLGEWQKALDEDADLLIYGCNLAANDDGVALVQQLADITGADVAASNDLTGTAAKGGDWDLEVRAGSVETTLLSVTQWDQLLVATAADDTATVWYDETIWGNLLTGEGSPGMQADTFDVDPDGELVSITFSGNTYQLNGGTITLTEADGLNGTLQISADGSFTYATTYNSTSYNAVDGWSGFTFHGYAPSASYYSGGTTLDTAWTNETANSVSNEDISGLAVNTGAITNRIDNVGGNSDALVVDLGGLYGQADITSTNLSSGEQLQWEAFDASGNRVGIGNFSGYMGGGASDYQTDAITTSSDFQYLVITALNAGDEFNVYEIQVAETQPLDEVFTYTARDNGDASSTSPEGTFTIQYANDNNLGRVELNGTAQQGLELTTVNLGDDDVILTDTLVYQWQSSADGATGWTNIAGANSDSYSSTQDDVGQYLRVSVSYYDDAGTVEQIVSPRSAQVTEGNEAGVVVISGTAAESQILTATTTDGDGTTTSTFSYQWQTSSDGSSWSNIGGATSDTYTLAQSDVDQYVRVQVTYTDDESQYESRNSDPTAQITATNDGNGVTLGGTEQEDQTLTATISDPDGYTSGATYTWERSDGVGGWTQISTGSSNTYTLDDADVGYSVRVTTDYTDDQGFSETGVQAVTGTIAGFNDGSSVGITGTPTEDQTLTATVTDPDGASGTITYTWERSADGSNGWTTITSSSATDYTLTDADVGNYLRVTVTYTDDQGFAETTQSAVTAQIDGVNDGSSLAISGTTTEDQTLSAVLTDADGASGTVTYTWERSADGSSGWTTVATSNSTDYALSDADVGQYLRVTATYTDDQGFSETPQSAVSGQINGVNDGSSIAISGTPTEDQTLTAAVTDADGATGTITYTWERSADGTSGWSTITSSTATDYTLTDADVGQYLRVTASYTDDQGFSENTQSAVSAQVAGINDGSTVTLSGTAAEDQTLTASVSDPDGATGTITYSWERSADGIGSWVTISGATASTYTLGDQDVDQYVRVTVSYVDDQGFSENTSSASSSQITNVNDPGSILITGTETEDQTLTASVTDLDGATGTITYQWQRSADGSTGWTAISGATASTYALSDGDVGQYVRVTASYTDDQGATENPVSASSGQIGNVNDTASVSVSGTESEDSTLTATITDLDGATGTITYQWQRSTDGSTGWTSISGANNSTYTLGDTDVDQYVRVTASYTDDQGTVENPVSAASGQIANINDTGSVAISGTEVEDSTLTAAITDLDGATGTITYQWERSADGSTGWSSISGATAATYTLTDADVDQYVRVTASYTDDQGTVENPVSAASAQIGNVNDTGTISFSGTEAEDSTLTASVLDLDGATGTITYQWQRSADGSSGWTSISGATAASYTLTDADVDQYVRVTASYTDDQGTVENPVSAASGQIGNVNDIGSISFTGTESEDSTLTASITDLDGATGTITYQWERSADGATGWTSISGATASTYTLTDADVDQYVRVTASYTDDHGTVENPVSGSSAQIGNVNDTGSISFSGTEAEDSTLTASVTDLDGATGTITYQWERSADGSSGWTSISGANNSTYTLGDADVDQYVRVTASYTDDQGTVENPVSAASGQITNINDAGSVAISGTEVEDSTLTAAITDLDGATGTITYQWERSADGSTGWSSISGATAATYTLTDADVDQYVRVTASYTDDQGTVENPVSAASGQIGNVNDTGTISFSGTEAEDSTLTASITDLDGATGTITYQWQRSADGSTGWTSISGATAATYTLGDADVDQYIRVTATYTDDQGTAENPVSAASGQIGNINDTGSISFSGTETEDSILTASITDLDGVTGTITYQWERSTDGATGWTSISGATASTYTLTDADVDQYVRVTASYTDDHGTVENPVSGSSAQIGNVNDIGSISFTGTESEDSTLSASVTDLDGATGTITYQWQRSSDGATGWTTITGATNSTYALGDADVDQYVRVTATYTDDQGTAENPVSTASGQIGNVNDTGSISFSGTEAEDSILTASITDLDGATGTITYQWQRSADGSTGWTSISGATASTYTLTDADVNQYVRVTASYTDDQGTVENPTSASSGQIGNVNDIGSVSFSGTESEDSTLSASITDLDGATGTITYQWQRSADGVTGWTPISGATASSYTLSDADVDQFVRVTASYTDDQGTAENPVSASSGQIGNINDTGSISFSGTEAEDSTLTASVTDLDGATGTITYQWQRSADGSSGWTSISGATAASYTLADADVDQYVRVTASYTDDQGTLESPVSESSSQIGNVNDTGSVSFTGTESEDSTLTASITDLDGATGTITYQWERSADGSTGWTSISGATAATYTLADADVDQYVRVTATYTDDQGTVENPISAASGQIGNINDTGTIAFSGTEAEDSTLTASVTDLDGATGTITYQWERSADGSTGWTSISGATASTYTLGDADVDQYIRVTATYTDDQGTVENPISAASGQIGNVNDIGSISFTGTESEDSTLTASITDLDGATGTITYQWERSADGSTGWTSISGATASTYTLGDADVDQYIRVTATYTDDQGTVETPVSASSGQIGNTNDAGTISFTGTETEDSILTASIIDLDGTTGTISYQWERSADGATGWTAISGATSANYTLADGDVDQFVRVTASYTDDQGTVENPVSAASGQIGNVNDTGAVNFSGTEAEDSTLTATVTDIDGSTGTITYQWERSTDGLTGWTAITGETAATYTLTDADVSQYVRVTASYTDDHGTVENPVSASSGQIGNVNDAGTISISGTETEDQTLAASISDIDGATGTITYQWQRSVDGSAGWTSISGANTATYTLTDADVDQYIRVTASYTDDQGTVENPISAASGQIGNINDTGSVSFTGSETEDSTLTAAVADLDGASGTVTYQWQRSADGSTGWTSITGATASSYTLTDADVDQYVRVTASYTDDQGTVENPVSAPSGQIGNINDTGTITFTGTEAEDSTLTATITDLDGATGAITYQWERSADGVTGWTSIASATAADYTLTDADVDQFVRVSASYTDDQGTAENPVSMSSGQIGNVNDIGTITFSGTETEDSTLTATITDLDGATGTITYQWEISADGSTGWTAITGATASSYTLTDTDVDQYIRVTASYTDDQGTLETPVSATSGQIGNINDTGFISFTGTENEDSTLTAAVTDIDGATGTINYQWERSIDGATGWTSITGATASTYTLGDADVDQYVRVTASYTDDHGTVENPISVSSGQIGNVNDIGSVSFTGTEAEDSTLTATITDLDGATGTITYQWEISADGSTGWTAITGATASSYTLTDTDVDQYVRVTASYSDDQGTLENPVSAASGQIGNINDLGTINLTGTEAEDSTLTATITDFDGATGTITYQWERSADGTTGWTAITGATAANYALTDADVNQYVRVTASYTDDQGTVENPVSSSSGQIGNINDIGTVAISGTETEDSTLTATLTDLDGATGTITYQWERSADGTTGWTAITGATAANYALTDADVNQYVRVTASYTDDQGTVENPVSSSSGQIGNINDIGTVAISGTETEDSTLTATITDFDGATGTITYQWEISADGSTGWTAITGATASSYTLTDTDVDQYVRVTASYTDDQGTVENPVSVSSGQIGNINDIGTITFTGAAIEDSTLTATMTDLDGATGTITYQWERSADGSTGWTAISGATAADYTLTDTDVDQFVRVTASYTDDQGTVENPVSAASTQIGNLNDAGTITVSGSASEDQTLNASVSDNDGISGAVTYIWQRSVDGSTGWADIGSSAGSSYTLTDVDVNQYIRAIANYTDDYGTAESVTSIANGPVANVNDAPVLQNAIANQVAVEDTPFSFTLPAGTFYDADGDTLALSAQLSDGNPLPAWLSFDNATGTFSGTPDAADIANLTISVYASDGSATAATGTFTLQINGVNDAPYTNGLANLTVAEDSQPTVIDLLNSFGDEETAGENIAFSIVGNTNLPLFQSASLNPDTQQLQLSYAQDQYGEATLTVRATDEQGMWVESSFTVTVTPVNDTPVAGNLAAINLVTGTQISGQVDLTNTFSDVEDNTLTYSIVGNSNPLVANVTAIDSDTRQLMLNFSPTVAGQTVITIRAMDSEGAYVDTTLAVTLTAAPITPPVEPPSEPSVPEEPTPTTPPVQPQEPSTPGGDSNRDFVPLSEGDRSFNAFLNLAQNLGDNPYRFEPGDYTGDDSRHDNKQKIFEVRQQVENEPGNSGLANLITTQSGYLSEQDIADFNNELIKLRTEMQEVIEEQSAQSAIYKGITISVTTGLIIWALRAGSLFLTLFSMIPIWRGLDPLPVVNNMQRRLETEKQKRDRDEEDKHSKEVGYLFDKQTGAQK